MEIGVETDRAVRQKEKIALASRGSIIAITVTSTNTNHYYCYKLLLLSICVLLLLLLLLSLLVGCRLAKRLVGKDWGRANGGVEAAKHVVRA